MENKLRKKPKISQKILLSVGTVLLVCAVVFITYYFTLNKEDSSYIGQLYKYKVEVDKANDIVVDASKKLDTIDIKDTQGISGIETQISTASSMLLQVLKDANQMNPPGKYRQQFTAYMDGISSNRKIFVQANLILKNTMSRNLDNAINALYGYISDTSKFYETSRLKKAYISLPSGIIAMTDKVHQYAFRYLNDYENRNRTLEQYTSYFSSMDTILSNFNNDKVDLTGELDKIKNGQISLDDAYVDIENKLSDLAGIQNSYTLLGVPPKMTEVHQQFNDIIKTYIQYCQDYKAALNKYEEAQNDPSLNEDVVFAFDDLTIRYKTLSKTFLDYMSTYNGDKTKYSDSNNL